MSSGIISIIGILLTILGIAFTSWGQWLEKKENKEKETLLESKQDQIIELQTLLNSRGISLEKRLTNVNNKIDSFSNSLDEKSFIDFKSIFDNRFERSINNHLVNYLGFKGLIKKYPDRTQKLSESIINDYYKGFSINEKLKNFYLENLFTFLYGSGINIKVLPSVKQLYYDLKTPIEAFNNSNNLEEQIESRKKFFSLFLNFKVNMLHERNSLLLLDNILELLREKSFEDILLEEIYLFRILEEVMLLSGEITENEVIGKYIFSSGITFDTDMLLNNYRLPKESVIDKYPEFFGINK